MQIIGAGLSRTGTMSTRAALERLGYPCYHMTETPRTKGHLEAWSSFASGAAPMDWHALFKQYAATVDLPGCLYYRELMAAFPKAKVLLNVREPHGWYDSLITLATALEEFQPLATAHPALNQFLNLTEVLGQTMTDGDFSRANCLRKFAAHNTAVQEFVPPDRLLVFRVQDGWAPLCQFLGHEVPEETFPHLNEGKATIRAFVQDMLLA